MSSKPPAGINLLMRAIQVSGIVAGYLFLIVVYLNNELNRHGLGVVFDSFGLTGLTVLFLLLLLHLTGWHLGSRFFRLRRIECSTELYSKLGVKHFQRLIRSRPLPTFTGRIALEGRSHAELRRLDDKMRKSEEAHALGIAANLGLTLLFGFLRDPRFFIWLSLFNIVINLYPTLVQRYNRTRVQRIMTRSPL